jgi:hypothetical protein
MEVKTRGLRECSNEGPAIRTESEPEPPLHPQEADGMPLTWRMQDNGGRIAGDH